MPSLVCIIPAEYRDQANALAEARGRGPQNFTIPVPSADAPTHYALRADEAQDWIDLLIAARDEGIWPDDMDVPEWADAVMQAMVIDASAELWGREHLQAVLVANGLSGESN